METKIPKAERLEFTQRLLEALSQAGESPSASAFARAFNLRSQGATITSHGARKWLKGGAIPTQKRVLVLAQWLNVQASWLRFGEHIDGATETEIARPALLSTTELMLIRDISLLPPFLQSVVRDLVDSLLRADRGQRKGSSRRPK